MPARTSLLSEDAAVLSNHDGSHLTPISEDAAVVLSNHDGSHLLWDSLRLEKFMLDGREAGWKAREQHDTASLSKPASLDLKAHSAALLELVVM